MLSKDLENTLNSFKLYRKPQDKMQNSQFKTGLVERYLTFCHLMGTKLFPNWSTMFLDTF